MNKINTMKLVTDFPTLYKGFYKSPSENLMCFGFECRDGWFDLIYDLSKQISEIDPNCEAFQVKEKFGGLRFYVAATTNRVHKLIRQAEEESLKICELCGSKEGVETKTHNGYWIRSMCINCVKGGK